MSQRVSLELNFTSRYRAHDLVGWNDDWSDIIHFNVVVGLNGMFNLITELHVSFWRFTSYLGLVVNACSSLCFVKDFDDERCVWNMVDTSFVSNG
jgi:hypothetical protein